MAVLIISIISVSSATTLRYPAINTHVSIQNKIAVKYRQPLVVTGKKTAQNMSSFKFRGAPAPDRHMFINRVENDTDIPDVIQFLAGENIPYKSVKCLSNPYAKFNSFKLTVAISKFQHYAFYIQELLGNHDVVILLDH